MLLLLTSVKLPLVYKGFVGTISKLIYLSQIKQRRIVEDEADGKQKGLLEEHDKLMDSSGP